MYVRGGKPLEHHTTLDNRRNIHSISKTFTSVAIGIARDEGLIDLDTSALSYLPGAEAYAAPNAEAITIRHLLTMTPGNDYRWASEDADHEGDPIEAFFASPMLDEPGTTFRYRGTNTYVLGRIIHRCSGEDLREYLLPRVFHPLGIANPQWHRCPLGFPLGADGLFLRTSEIGRLGETLLEGGAFRGRRIVSSDYVHEMSTAVVPSTNERDDPESSAGYGLQVWRCTRPDTWRMDGLYGQFCIVMSDLGACVSLNSHYEGNTGDILRAVWSDLVPALEAELADTPRWLSPVIPHTTARAS